MRKVVASPYMSLDVNACVNLRRNNFDPLSFSFQC
jgi:hypothetical protein